MAVIGVMAGAVLGRVRALRGWAEQVAGLWVSRVGRRRVEGVV